MDNAALALDLHFLIQLNLGMNALDAVLYKNFRIIQNFFSYTIMRTGCDISYVVIGTVLGGTFWSRNYLFGVSDWNDGNYDNQYNRKNTKNMNINGDMKPIDEGAGEDKQRKRLAFVLPKELEIKRQD